MKKEKKKKRLKRAGEQAERLGRPAREASDAWEAPRAGAASNAREAKEPAPLSPLQYAVSQIGGKWKMRILWELRAGEVLRYRELRQGIPGITDMMLSQSLRELASSGLVERRQYQEIPPKVEYCITPDGQELMPALEILCAWAEKRMKE